MSIFGVGPMEVLLVLVLALLVFGPEDIIALARRVGTWWRKIRGTETWRAVTRTSYELQHLQQRLYEESGLADPDLINPMHTAWQASPPPRGAYTAPPDLLHPAEPTPPAPPDAPHS